MKKKLLKVKVIYIVIVVNLWKEDIRCFGLDLFMIDQYEKIGMLWSDS